MTVTASTSGSRSPFIERCTVCQVNELLSICLIMLTADDLLPSGSVPVCWINQRLPLRVHLPSAKPPSESNTQERICFATESQPTICIPDMFTWSPTTTANERVMKFLFLAQLQSVWIVASSSSSLSIHEPTIHSRSFKCSYFDGGGVGGAGGSSSVTRSSNHLPSRLTKRAE